MAHKNQVPYWRNILLRENKIKFAVKYLSLVLLQMDDFWSHDVGPHQIKKNCARTLDSYCMA